MRIGFAISRYAHPKVLLFHKKSEFYSDVDVGLPEDNLFMMEEAPLPDEASSYLLLSAFGLLVLALTLAIFRAEMPDTRGVPKETSQVNLELNS